MIDIHSHILPGLDDGVATIEEARELARTTVADGVTAIAATPHVRDDYPTTPEQMEAGVAALRADFAAEGIPLEVLHGGELALESVGSLSDDDLRRFTIGQTGRYLLLEFPYFGWPLALRSIVFNLQLKGFTALLAHPERNGEVQAAPERLRELVDAGVGVQVTAASIDGRGGRTARRTARALIELGFVHAIASDAHSPSLREAGVAAAARELDDEDLARFLTVEAPAAIAAGRALPGRFRG